MTISRSQALSRDRLWWWDGHAWQPTLGTSLQDRRPPADWRRHVPGFRHGSAWRMVVAVLGYAGFAITLGTTLANLNLAGFFGELAALALLLLVADAFGIQSRLGVLWAVAALVLAAAVVLLLAPSFVRGFERGCQSSPASCQVMRDSPAYVAGRVTIPVLLFLAPSLIALARRVPDRWLAVWVNVLLGLTCLGWVVALALSLERRANRLAVPLSGDHRWWWSGDRWTDSLVAIPPMAARTPDGAWWWDGAQWRAAGTGTAAGGVPGAS